MPAKKKTKKHPAVHLSLALRTECQTFLSVKVLGLTIEKESVSSFPEMVKRQKSFLFASCTS